MSAIVSIVVMGALTLAASADDVRVRGSGSAAHYVQADQVSVIKVEGMT